MAQQFLSDIQSARALAPVLVPVSAPAPATACAQPRTNEATLVEASAVTETSTPMEASVQARVLVPVSGAEKMKSPNAPDSYLTYLHAPQTARDSQGNKSSERVAVHRLLSAPVGVCALSWKTCIRKLTVHRTSLHSSKKFSQDSYRHVMEPKSPPAVSF